MKVIVAAARGILAIALTFIVIDAAKADPATEVAAMGGVITAIVTVEAIDAPNRLLTVVGPDGTLVIKLGPDVQHIEKIKVKEKVTINYTENGFGVLRDGIACKPAIMAETDRYVAFGSEYRALAGLPGIENARVWEPEPATVYFWER